ncbi:MAG: hypothetical protein ACRDZN_16415 [Acidimicrobiales bacterium]
MGHGRADAEVGECRLPRPADLARGAPDVVVPQRVAGGDDHVDPDRVAGLDQHHAPARASRDHHDVEGTGIAKLLGFIADYDQSAKPFNWTCAADPLVA